MSVEVGRWRKKPIEIKAVQYTGDNWVDLHNEGWVDGFDVTGSPFIETLEGRMRVSRWDFIIKGVNGERYPCNNRIFYQTYDLVGMKEKTEPNHDSEM